MTPPGPDPSIDRDSDRHQRFRRRRARALGDAALAASGVGLLGGLLLAPNDLAGLRVAGVALAWWVALVVIAAAALGLALGSPPRPDR